MKILITGGSGFIGSHLVDHLSEKGHSVSIMDIAEPKWNKDVEFYKTDVTNLLAVSEAVIGKDLVIHLAGLLGTHELVDNVSEAVRVNIGGTVNVLEACSINNVKLIEISKPNCWVNAYTITKVAVEGLTEMYRRESGLKACVVKWFNVYGGRQPLEEEIGYKKAVPTWIVNALRGKDIEIYGDGEQTVDLIHTTDCNESMELIIDNFDKCEGKTFEIGSGEETTCNELASTIAELGNVRIKHTSMRKGETGNTRIKADLTEIKNTLNWKPRISLAEGMAETIKWYGDNYSDTNKE